MGPWCSRKDVVPSFSPDQSSLKYHNNFLKAVLAVRHLESCLKTGSKNEAEGENSGFSVFKK